MSQLSEFNWKEDFSKGERLFLRWASDRPRRLPQGHRPDHEILEERRSLPPAGSACGDVVYVYMDLEKVFRRQILILVT